MEQFFQELAKHLEVIYPYIVAILPAITAIGTVLIAVLKICKQFKDLRKEVSDKTDINDARAEMKQIISEDRALKRRLDKLITLESKVKQYDIDEEV